MKKLLSVLFVTALIFTACEGDRGPQGPPGEPGEPGDELLGYVFEAEVDFEAEDYSVFVEIPDDVEISDTDVVLVYLLEDVDEDADVWSMLPQTFYLDEGELEYNFNHTYFDVNIFLDGNVNLDDLGPEFTDDQLFRIAVLPADFAETTGIDVANMGAVINAVDVKEQDIKKAKVIKK